MKFFEAVANVFRVPDLRKRLLFALALLAVYRLGGHIPTPGVDANRLSDFFTRNAGSFGTDARNTFPVVARYQTALAHTDERGNPTLPATAKFVPRHAAVVRQVDALLVVAIRDHPVAAGKVEIQPLALRHAQHDDYGLLVGESIS